MKELDVLRFVAILFVVMNHLEGRVELFYWSPAILATSPIMACISSYLLFRNIGHPKIFIPKLKNRVQSLIIPYLLWTFVIFIITQIVRVFTSSSSSTIFSLKSHTPDWSFFNYWNNFIVHPNPPAFWYLQNLILILPFCFIIYYLVSLKWSIILLFPIIGICYHYHLILYFSERFLPYYLFGAWLGIHYSRGFPILNGNGYLLFFTLISLLVWNSSTLAYLGIYKFIVEYCIQVGIFIVGVSAIRQFNRTFVIYYFNNKMHLSFYLHAAHTLFIGAISSILVTVFKYFNILVIDNICLQFICIVTVFILSYKLIELLTDRMRVETPKLYSALSGGRHSPKYGSSGI